MKTAKTKIMTMTSGEDEDEDEDEDDDDDPGHVDDTAGKHHHSKVKLGVDEEVDASSTEEAAEPVDVGEVGFWTR